MAKSAAATTLNLIMARRPRLSPKPHLKALITLRGYTQRQAADRIGISEQRLSDIICGRVMPTDDEVRRLARFLRVTIEDILDGDAPTGRRRSARAAR